MLKSIRILKFPALLAGILLMVAGCSGSSGGGPGASNPDNPFEGAPASAAPVGRSAKATPREGSVTQSSVLADAIDVRITGFGGASATYEVENVNTARNWSVDSREIIPIEFEGTDDLAFEAEVTGGNVYVALLTEDIGGATDYLAYGLWVYVPTAGDPEIGVFMDSNEGARFNQTNLVTLAGNATYTGVAGGIYSDLADGDGEVSSLTGDVALTAAFGIASDPGTIRGTISRLRDIHDNVYEDSVIILGGTSRTDGASIVADVPGGFFTGNTFFEADTGDGSESFTGRWGGQFFVNGAEAADHPENVAGTFGLANGDNTQSFLGVFLAELGGGS